MRLGLLADIHANREALGAVMARLESARIDRLVFLGDLVGYGPDPEFCLETAMRAVERGAWIVLGNHDAAIRESRADLNPNARRAIEWTRSRLSAAHHRFLADLPATRREDDLLVVHASAHDPRAWEYVTGPIEADRSLRATDAQITLVGHVHRPSLWHPGRDGGALGHIPAPGVAIPLARTTRWLAVLGAVGQPRDGNPAAAFGVLDTAARTLAFERIAYDHAATSRKMRNAGLPEALASRILIGR